jgi:hypothetical protein
MTVGPRAPASRAIDAILRQTSDLRRLCLSLREARNCEQEARLVAEFGRAVLTPEGAACLDLPALQSGFRNLWKEGRYDRIVAVGRILSKDLLEGDETVFMYYTCAARRQAEGVLGHRESA